MEQTRLARGYYSFCKQKLVMPTEMIAQNGAAALKACSKKGKGKGRAGCEKAARREFGAVAWRGRGRG